MILVYISPLLSALVLVLIPVASVYLLPGLSVRFFSAQQFSFAGVPVQNIHIMLSVWSAVIGIVAYTEVLSWYLSKDEKSEPGKKTVPAAGSISSKPEEPAKSLKTKAEVFMLKLGKVLSGKK